MSPNPNVMSKESAQRLSYNIEELRSIAGYLRGQSNSLTSQVQGWKTYIANLSANWSGPDFDLVKEKIDKCSQRLDTVIYEEYKMLAEKFEQAANLLEENSVRFKSQINQIN